MEDKPTIGDSKKKGLATIAITALAAMHTPETVKYVIAGIVLIAVVGMCIFGWLENGRKK